MKSTLTAMSALALLIIAACLAFPKLGKQEKTISKKTFSHLEVKTANHEKVSKEEKVTVKFGVNAFFGPKPEN
jgi:hypothetical protein